MTGAVRPAGEPRGGPGRRAPGLAARVGQVLWLFVPPAVLVWLGWEQRWVAEDAFIDLRVVQHLLAGHGPVYNLGERVEAYTNPLWLALLTGLALLASPFAGPGPAVSATPAGAAAGAAGDLPWGTVPLEWIAVFAGLVTAGAGLLAAELGALRLARRLGATGLALPLGAVVFVAVPAAWDYVTSGLETGLILSWLGLTFWVLAAGGAARHPYACAFLVGLGPLIRPDLAIFGAAFLLILLAGAGWRPPVWAGILLAGAAAPVAYQVFRMGYFGVLVPNTALAKEAGMTYWPQGWRYLRDFVSPYALWLPLVPCLLWGLALLGRALGRGDGARRAVLPLVILPPAAALLHALYVVRVGGDFMHGRMLLPTLFALLLPMMVVAGHRWWLPLLPLGVVLPWAIVAALWLRPPYFNAGPDPPESVGREGIADERGFYVRFARHPHPVTLADYEAASWAQDGHALRHLAAQERGLLTWQGSPPPGIPGAPGTPQLEALAPEVVADVVAVRNNIGLTGYAAGPRVHVVDRLGLSDPIASRLRLARRGRPGHEKELPDAWVVARFGPQAPEEGGHVAAARAALGCGDLGALLPAMEAPLTAERFEENLGAAWRLTTLRFPADPSAARAELCP